MSNVSNNIEDNITKSVKFTVSYSEGGTKGEVTADDNYDITTLLYVWVKITESVASQGIGNAKSLNFIRKVYDDFKKEFMS